MVGRTLRIDENSLRISGQGQLEEIIDRGRFARFCVEVDLSKSLLSKFRIGHRQLYIGYEGLHMICFLCGQYGHKKEHCLFNPDNTKKDEEDADVEMNGQNSGHSHSEDTWKEEVERSQEVNGFVKWMTIQKRNNKRPIQQLRSKENLVSKERPNAGGKEHGTKNTASGSRFGPLEEETDDYAPGQKLGDSGTISNNGKNVVDLNQQKKSQGGRKKKSNTESGDLNQGVGTEVKASGKQVPISNPSETR
ncbi:uncharacterized protein LOC133314790 [Gastrolobium bilobum]|uniref:uncharacterized protein LOC133314790 n=1 Tax=Gastrolobium bilobum TaxID=150636 RepID=UPI002AB04457|nr:uncharacterized protein LOC133314790 [Gastrolobium bilobum]